MHNQALVQGHMLSSTFFGQVLSIIIEERNSIVPNLLLFVTADFYISTIVQLLGIPNQNRNEKNPGKYPDYQSGVITTTPPGLTILAT